MKPITPSSLIRSAALAVLLHASLATAQAQEVTVALLPEATVDDTVVTLEQIATLSGGAPALRKRLSKLDVIDFPCGVSHRVVTSDLVRLRLLLADVESSDFRMSGAKRTTIVEPAGSVTLRKLIAAAEQATRARYPGDGANATLTASKSVTVPTVETGPGDRVRLEGAVNGPVPLNGRVRVDVSVSVNGKKREVVPIFLEIAQRDAGLEQPIRAVANWLPAADPASVVIKAHDNVKIVVVVGAARIEAIGEAQQDGKVGQIIRVRNVDSNRIVHGRVEASGIVAVD